ncbi:MAG TPA: M20/M25/M40 family metallo-hydrolase [Terriglobales bacterium]
MTLRFPRHFALRAAAALLALAIAAPANLLAASSSAATSDAVNLEVMTQIRQEGFHNSKVMEIEGQLTDVIGPRLTGSPAMKRANEWTRDQFTEWGLVNSHLESFPFGRGWSNDYTQVRMVAPQNAEIIAYPKAWTVSTNGALRASVVKAKLATQEDLDKQKGKLAGKIVFNGDMREVKPQSEAALQRYDDKKLAEIAQYEIPSEKPRYSREEIAQRIAFQKTLNQFLMDEHVAAIIDPSRSGDGGTVFVQGGGPYKPGDPAGVPSLVMAIENYGRISRLVDRNIPVELELEVRNQFYDADPNAYNTVAEIPGTDKSGEVVMLGAHLDSWHGGTGATDNAAGSAITMEAIRILKAIGVKPRHTIRIALWSGEEEGLLGSHAYVKEHFGSHAEPADPKELAMPEWLRKDDTPLNLKPEQAKVSAYFNVDNGTGKIRGIYLEGNESIKPIFNDWMQPFTDLGMTTLTMRNTGGTDHESFDAVGIPGFQFIQDPVEYMTRTHHSNEDVYERIQRDDMMQAAVILAGYVYDAAMRDTRLPRKPLPKPAPAKPETPKPDGAKQ